MRSRRGASAHPRFSTSSIFKLKDAPDLRVLGRRPQMDPSAIRLTIFTIERGSWSTLLAHCLISCELEQTESVGIMSYNRDRICRHCHWYRRIIHAKIRILNLVLFPFFHHKRTLVTPMESGCIIGDATPGGTHQN